MGCSDYFGLSDTVDLATMPFLFIGRALNSRKQDQTRKSWERGESLGSGGDGQSVNAEAGLHTRTGHLLPRTMMFPDARNTTEGEGGKLSS